VKRENFEETHDKTFSEGRCDVRAGRGAQIKAQHPVSAETCSRFLGNTIRMGPTDSDTFPEYFLLPRRTS